MLTGNLGCFTIVDLKVDCCALLAGGFLYWNMRYHNLMQEAMVFTGFRGIKF